MKRIICVFLSLMFLFCACGKEDNLSPYVSETALQTTKAETTAVQLTEETTQKIKIENYVSSPSQESTSAAEALPYVSVKQDSFFVSSWLSYIELTVISGRNTAESYASYIDGIFDNMKAVGVTDVFVQVRPFADAFYPSDIFPTSAHVAGKQGAELPFDVFGVITQRAALKNLSVHAWINPYRVSSSGNIDSLSAENPARSMYKQGSNEDVAVTEKGIYFNPSSEKVMKLIIDGARELLNKYNIRGIHIDDYFYFDDCGDFDSQQYKKYTAQGGTLSLADWRRENVSCLLSGLYTAVKSFGTDKIFSVSPGGDISRCYNENYADVYLWCREEGYCDMIVPQIYFGFENEKQPFSRCLDDWMALCRDSSVKLTAGLALYKAGKEDTYAFSGKDEWINNSDIIARQAALVKEKNCYGIAVYSGSYIDFSEKIFADELNNLKSVVL
ncbi:MAG: family 10 glycosylhydrolase [Clostridia bacterium]|nr:family 10 glycosylhydrolase [Clostridia bacterium]